MCMHLTDYKPFFCETVGPGIIVELQSLTYISHSSRLARISVSRVSKEYPLVAIGNN